MLEDITLRKGDIIHYKFRRILQMRVPLRGRARRGGEAALQQTAQRRASVPQRL